MVVRDEKTGPQERLKQVAMLRDPKFYLENFCKIKGKTPGLTPFILKPAQLDLYNNLRVSNRVIILKARQLGFSTAITGYFYHKTITTPGTTTALIAHKAEVAAEFLDKVKTFWRSTPEVLRPQIHFNSKFEMSFPALDSKIMVMSGDNVGRGFTIHNALLSEMAMWEKPEEMMNAIENAVPVNGQIVIESTPMGVGNLYHRMWANPDNGYVKLEYGWWWEYSKEEIETIRRRINDPLRFAQEYELEFLSSGRQVFHPHLIRKIQKNILKVGDEVKIDEHNTHTVYERPDKLRIYKPPVDGELYVLGADVAEGVTGGDFSTCIIYHRKTGEEVAFFRGHMPADKFGEALDGWGRLYNQALAVVEINNHGLTTVTAMRNKMYPQMYFRQKQYDKVSSGMSDRLGWKTTKVTRPLMIDDFAEALRDDAITLHSEEIMNEMVTFIFDLGNNMVSMSGFHDDGIFCGAIGFQGFKVMYAGELDQLNYEAHLPSGTAY